MNESKDYKYIKRSNFEGLKRLRLDTVLRKSKNKWSIKAGQFCIAKLTLLSD